ncbi:MAG: ABC transporter permease [Clostridiaceae bacterium]|nr:ABC transporter permease [Clostridiaceae bacterium]
MNSRNINLIKKLFPFFSLFIILIVFTIMRYSMFWSVSNLRAILNNWVPLVIGGAGLIFVNAQGSVDISLGGTLAFSATIAAILSNSLGYLTFIPIAILIGLINGLFIGFVVGYFKVPSIMVSLAMMMSLSAIVAYITGGQSVFISPKLFKLNEISVKLIATLIVLIVTAILFSKTKIGFFSKSIGENEETARYSGVNVVKYKMLAFGISGLLAGLAGTFTSASIGGIIPNMGNMYQLQILMGLFLGGAPVSGGSGTKYYQLVLGSLTLAVLQSGLVLMGTSAAISAIIQGLILLIVVYIGIYSNNKFLALETKRASLESLKE